jgi:hypothetical protein
MMNQSRTGSEPIVSTYKNDKNEKNDNKHRGDFYLSSEQKKIQRIHDANERAFEQWLEEETKISRV